MLTQTATIEFNIIPEETTVLSFKQQAPRGPKTPMAVNQRFDQSEELLWFL